MSSLFTSSDPDEMHLKELYQARDREISCFFQDHPDIAEICDTLYVVGSAMPLQEASAESVGANSTWCNLLWQRAADYLNDSFFLIIGGSLDSGLALIRMATELARDVAVMRSDSSTARLWLDRENQRSKYRKRFRFDTDTPLGEAAQFIYRFCSQKGVHGHTTNFAHHELHTFKTKAAEITTLSVTKAGILDILGIWIRAFTPIHGICAASNSGDGPEIYTSAELFNRFKECSSSLPSILASIETSTSHVRNPE